MNQIPKNKIAVNEKNSHIWDEDDDGGEQNQVYATVKNTYLGTPGPEKYFNVQSPCQWPQAMKTYRTPTFLCLYMLHFLIFHVMYACPFFLYIQFSLPVFLLFQSE